MADDDQTPPAIDTGDNGQQTELEMFHPGFTPQDSAGASFNNYQQMGLPSPQSSPSGGDEFVPVPGQNVAPNAGTGAISVEDDASGVDRQANNQQIQNAPMDPMGDQPGANRIAKMLAGEGAVNPALLQQINEQSRRGLHDTPADTGVYAIHDALQKHGPDAAVAVVQANRLAWDAKNMFALQAMNGTANKRPDLKAAIDAANQAQEHMPDGSNVIFSPNGNHGVIAVVTPPGSTHSVQFNLSLPQFKQFVDVGHDGQFDKIFNQGVSGTLQRLANATSGRDSDSDEGPSPQANVGKRPVKAQSDDDEDEDTRPPGGSPSNGVSTEQNLRDGSGYQPRRYAAPHAQSLDAFPGRDMEFAGNTKGDNAIDAENRKNGLFAGDQPPLPGTHDANGKYIGKNKRTDLGLGSESEARMDQIYGKGNINARPARVRFQMAQEQEDMNRENKLEQERIKGVNMSDREHVRNVGRAASDQVKKEIAESRNQTWKYSTDQKAKAAEDRIKYLYYQEAARNRNSAAAHELGILKAKIAASGANGLNEEDQRLAKKYGVAADQALSDTSQPTAPQGAPHEHPQQQSAPQGRAPVTLPPKESRVPGKTMAKDYQGRDIVWQADGWHLVQRQ